MFALAGTNSKRLNELSDKLWHMLLGLLSLLLLCTASPALALPSSVKVTLFQAHPDITVLAVDGPFEISQGAGSGFASGAGLASANHAEISLAKGGLFLKTGGGAKPGRRLGARIIIRPSSPKPLRLQPNTLAGSSRLYRGRFFVTARGGKIEVVNEVDTKSYITSVVGSETLPDFPLETLKAQAVLASTVLARQRPNVKLSDSTDVQAYLGSDYERPLAQQAVAAVFGQKLETSNGTTPAVFYHSTCAGGTSDEREIFSGKELNDAARKPVSSCRTASRVKCSYCKDSPFFQAHRVQVSADQLRRKIGYVPLAIEVKDPEGRPLSVKVERLLPARPESNNESRIDSKLDSKIDSVSGYELWLKLGQAFGWGEVPGMRYSIESGPIVTITSTGAGHGAGLCQWGAYGMAKSGKNYREILHYYFPLAQVSGK